jgi:hypothetical protein
MISQESLVQQGTVSLKGSPDLPPKELLLILPSELLKLADKCENEIAALEYYDSATTAIHSWSQYRNPRDMADWQSLVFDVISGRLRIQLRLGDVERELYKRNFDNALAYTTYEFIAIDKKVDFLRRYAQVRENWGEPGAAISLLSRALLFDNQNEETLSELRRLRGSLSDDRYALLRTANGLFGNPVPTTSRIKLSAGHQFLGSKCTVCSDILSVGKEVHEIDGCGHIFHEGCILQWLRTNPETTCPNCGNPF